MILLCLLWGTARADAEPPDYAESLAIAAEAEADQLLADGRLEEALTLVRAFRASVLEHPRIAYEEALILRHMDRADEAADLLLEVTTEHPDMAAPWYDLGEIYLSRGRMAEARAAFQEATRRTEEHPLGWAGPYRLAEVAAFEEDPQAFEAALREALRRGFSFSRTVGGDPRWAGFLAHPALGPILRQIVTVYGEEAVLETWSSPDR